MLKAASKLLLQRKDAQKALVNQKLLCPVALEFLSVLPALNHEETKFEPEWFEECSALQFSVQLSPKGCSLAGCSSSIR